MRYTSPEKKGIPTEALKKYVEHLECHGLNTHSLIVARGNDIVLEKYWEPFGRDFLHRMYSVTKSFVAIAIGFLADIYLSEEEIEAVITLAKRILNDKK